MTPTEGPPTSTSHIEAALAIAAEHQHAAKRVADRIRVHYMRAELQNLFPDHTLAVFSRECGEHEPQLLQLLSSSGEVEEIDFSGDAGSPLSAVQLRAIELVNNLVSDIGSDEDLLVHLDAGGEEHEGWVEFNLDLTHGNPM